MKKYIITKSKFGNIRIINIMMYLTVNIFCNTPIYLRMLFYWATKSWALRINKCEICIIEKSKKIHSKNSKLIFSGTVEKNCSWHNSMPEKCRTLFKYENDIYICCNNWLTTLYFTQMRWRVEKGDVLGWTTSIQEVNYSNDDVLVPEK